MSVNKPQYLIVHHTGGTDADPKADTSHHTFDVVNDWHKQTMNFKSSLGFYIGYHYFIDRDGNVKQGRADNEEGAHTIGKNNVSLGICLAGNFDVTEPTQAQKTALATLLKGKMSQYAIPLANVLPHRHFASKTCYGSRLSETWAQELVRQAPATPTTPKVTPPNNGELIDGIRAHMTAIEALLGKIDKQS